MTTIGKYRHLCHCSTEAGHFVILALDHRANLLEALNKYAPAPLDDEAFAAFKQGAIASLVEEASAVLTDPAFGLGRGVAQRVIPGHVGLLAPVEVTDYSQHPSRRRVEFIPGWSVAKIKRVGGSGVKLLLPYHPDAADVVQKDATVRHLVDECGQHDIPFFLEPIPYSPDPPRKLNNAELLQITVQMARHFSTLGVDVLKLQFPVDPDESRDEAVWRSACREVDVASRVPWVLLSGGVDYATFATQAQIACVAGASGVIVGRAVWSEATRLQGEARVTFLKTDALARLNELAQLCEDYAQPWFNRTDAPNPSLQWYEQY